MAQREELKTPFPHLPPQFGAEHPLALLNTELRARFHGVNTASVARPVMSRIEPQPSREGKHFRGRFVA